MPLFLSDEEFSRCSGNAALVAERADDFIRRLTVELETVRAQADAAAITAEQTCSLLEQKYLTITSDFSDLQSQCSQLQASLDQRLVELADVQAQKSQVHLQCIEKDGEIERLSTETSHLQTSKRQLMQVVEHKDAEISEKNMSIKSYLDKIGQLIDNASQKDARLNEKEAELARVQANCSRLVQEKEIIQRQNAWLSDELKDKVDSLLESRRTIGDLEAQMSSKIADAEREFNDCSSSLKWNKERVKELEGKVTFLQEELRSCKESASANEERFSAELSTVHKLVELYKESSEEWSRKAGELEGVIKALEVHLSQVENDYKDKLEKEISSRRQAEKEAEDLKAKLEKCETDIESLRKQNELNLLPLSSFNTERWTGSLESNDNVDDGAIVPKVPTGVSGTALAASLLRDGWSLVKMYTKYQEAVDALRHEQMGRKEAEAVMQRVLYELEEKADVIMEERAEHERMVEAYSAINEKLHESTSEQYNLEKTIQGLKADLKKHERDYQLAQHEITDLRSQVTVLLKECRDIQIRCGSDPHESDEEMVMDAFELNEESDIEKVIRERLLTFKDIHGLVEQNVKLRSLVRNLSHQIADQEAEFKVKFEMELKNHTEEAASKVAAVLQRAEEQTQMIESLHTSVAMYKRLYEEEHKRHSTPPEAAIVSQDDGRTDVRLLIQGSQEAAKRAQEKAAERVRCLEEEYEKSRSKIIALQSERDKLALEAEFFREKVDTIMKESEHKRGELDGVLSRNVEFSQLIVDYQRKLRDSYESLQAAEDQTRKLTMEVSILKQEKEVLANAEKRASDEIRSLSERVYRLQATLDTIQSAEGVREEGRVVEKGRHEEYLNQLQREWTEAKKELQNERDNVRNLTRERDVPLREAMKQVEEMRKELANALKAGAAAESRAAVAEGRLSDLERTIQSSNSEVDRSGGSAVLTNEIAPTLQISKEEMEKLKEEANANKEHMLQYKSIAQVNEAALKQMEYAHETYKNEAERLKNSLEAEVISLRERVSELENQLNLKSAELASLVAGKEEVLASVSTEVSSLKEEIVSKSSQMLQLETRNSLLEDKWKSEHEKWRSAQANYERQVVLQSETIQELTRTSEAFSLLEKEASELRRSSDDLKRENKELESKLLEAKSVLEEITSSSEKRYNELNEQNKLLHDRLEALHIHLAEKDRYGRTSGGLGQDPAGDSGLQNVINYLRRSKEIGETEISLLKQEKWRLQSQLESAMKAAESAQATLQADRASLKASMITEKEFKSLQLQIRELNLLRESNEQLREENKHNFEECQRLRELAQKARSEIENLEKQLTLSQNLVEACKKEIEMHKEEKSQLDKRVTELLERCGSIDIEHYECMKKEVSQLQEKLKEKDAQIEGIKVLAAQRQDKITQLERDLQTVRSELSDKEKRLQDISQSEEKQRRLVTQLKRKAADIATKEKEDLAREKQAFLKQSKEKEDLVKEKQALVKQLEDLKQVERPSGDVNMEQLMKEKEEKDTRIQTLERALQNLRDSLKKERDKRQQSEKTIVESLKRADEGKAKVTNDLDMYKQAVKQLSDEVEKIKHVEGSLPEGTSVIQLLSGNSVDDLASVYVSALESFEQVAHSLANQLGARPSSREATETPSLTPAVAATGAAPEGSNTSAVKPTEEKEKASSAPKRAISETTRRVARRLVRPPGPPRSAAAADEPSQDVEMAEGGTQETEAVPAAAAPQQSMKKRQASPSPPEAAQEPSDVAAPLIKRSKVQDEATTSQVEPDTVVTEKEADLQMEESQEKAEEESDPLPAEVGGGITEEVQIMDENLDKPEGEAADELGDQAEEAPENDDKEEGEAALDVADDIVGSPELTTEDTAEVAGGASPGRVAADDVDVEGGEVAGEGEDGEITEDAAEEKNEQASETTAAAEAPAVAVASSEQQGSSSPTPNSASGGSVAAPAAGEVAAEIKQQQQQQQRSSPSPNIVNLRKSAEVGAAERLRNRVIPTTAPPSRGGRAGRIIGRGRAGRVIGRGKPPGGEQGGQGSGASR